MKLHNQFASSTQSISVGSLSVAALAATLGMGWFSVNAEAQPVYAYVQPESRLLKQGIAISQVTFIEQDGDTRAAEFVVPEQDPSVSVNGGSLRHYDMHVARMVEITDYECRQPGRQWSQVNWQYRVGSVELGNFSISCDLARDTAISYGSSGPELMAVTYYNAPTVITVPILNITNAKVEQWITFTQSFLNVSPIAGNPGGPTFGN